MGYRAVQKDGLFRIDRQGYDTEDTKKKAERVDVSPFGTEGIFIDIDLPKKEVETNDQNGRAAEGISGQANSGFTSGD
jgi:hypothetical protein